MSFGSIPAGAHVGRSVDTDSETETPVSIEPGESFEHQTRRWYGVTAFALVALGVGVVTAQSSLLLASAFGIAFAGYGRLTTAPEPELELERTVSDERPEVGETVTVTLTARNVGDRTLPDLRLVDGVPPGLTVEAGTPRLGKPLRPGAEATVSYRVRAGRGAHEFEPAMAISRDVSGASERIDWAETDTTVACEPSLPSRGVEFPLRSQTSQYTGRFPADSGGPGVEFYATREYRPGDPLSRIDWNRTARTGELTTVEYRVERTVTVAMVFDARSTAYAAPEPYGQSAVERSVDAARHVYVSLADEGHEVGVGALSPVDCWLPPSRGDQHRVRVREHLATHPALSPDPPEDETNIYAAVQRLRGRLPADSQVVLFSPLTDQRIVASAIRLDAHGYPTTVVSPDPTAEDTAGHQLAATRRRLRIADLRRRGIPVVDWGGDEDLSHAIVETERRWSR